MNADADVRIGTSLALKQTVRSRPTPVVAHAVVEWPPRVESGPWHRQD